VYEERGPLGRLEQLLMRVITAPQRKRLALAFVPTVWEVRNAMRRHTDLRELVRAVTPAQPAVDTWRPRADVITGVRWAVSLVYGSQATCLTRALSIYSALRQHGWPVTFVTGVRLVPDADRVSAHAWVEYRGVVLPELREPENRSLFTENFRFPAE
jgi:Transglutaminase-like superfamily